MNPSNSITEVCDETIAAFKLINDFFDAGELKDHRRDLKKWRYYVINDKQYKSRNGTRYLLNVYEDNLSLIEAAHLLACHSQALSIMLTVTKEEFKHEMVSCPVPNLSQKEWVNPLKAINKFFKSTSAVQYKEVLHEWLGMALSNKILIEALSPKVIIDTYDNLRKLYSAAYLIHRRKKKFI